MQEPIAEGVGDGRIADDFEEVSPLGLADRHQAPVVEDEQFGAGDASQ